MLWSGGDQCIDAIAGQGMRCQNKIWDGPKTKGTKLNVTKSENQREAEKTNERQSHTETHRVTQSYTKSH